MGAKINCSREGTLVFSSRTTHGNLHNEWLLCWCQWWQMWESYVDFWCEILCQCSLSALRNCCSGKWHVSVPCNTGSKYRHTCLTMHNSTGSWIVGWDSGWANLRKLRETWTQTIPWPWSLLSLYSCIGSYCFHFSSLPFSFSPSPFLSFLTFVFFPPLPFCSFLSSLPTSMFPFLFFRIPALSEQK